VLYKGEPLEADRGPGLGCFWIQVAMLVIAVALAPLSVSWGWPTPVSFALFALVMVLLLFAGQTVIFLLRLVAAERRGRRRPLGTTSPTVGQIEDEGTAAPASGPAPDPGDGPGSPAVRE
jgi:membrane protein implicated in regulation of membrane protease activity